MSYLGKNLVLLRKNIGMSQSEICAHLEFNKSTVSNWENDYAVPDVSTLIELSNFFEVTLDELLKTDLSKGNLISKTYTSEKTLKGNLKGNPIGNLKGENDHNSGIVKEAVNGYQKGTGTHSSGNYSLADQLRQAQDMITTQAITIKALQSALNHAEQRLSDLDKHAQ